MEAGREVEEESDGPPVGVNAADVTEEQKEEPEVVRDTGTEGAKAVLNDSLPEEAAVQNEVDEDNEVVKETDITEETDVTEAGDTMQMIEDTLPALASEHNTVELDSIEDTLREAATGFWNFASLSLNKVQTAARETNLDVITKGIGGVSELGGSPLDVPRTINEENEKIGDALKSSTAVGSDRVVPQELDFQKEIFNISESVTGAFGAWSGLLKSAANDLTAKLPTGLDGTSATPGMERRGSVKVPMDRFRRKVREMQANPDTYCQTPADPEAFAAFQESFDLSGKQDTIGTVLKDNPEINVSFPCNAISIGLLTLVGNLKLGLTLLSVSSPWNSLPEHLIQSLYTRTVPRLIDHELFWSRYFFALAKLENEEQRRVSLLNEQKQEESMTWSDDEDEDANAKDANGAEDAAQATIVNVEETNDPQVEPAGDSADVTDPSAESGGVEQKYEEEEEDEEWE